MTKAIGILAAALTLGGAGAAQAAQDEPERDTGSPAAIEAMRDKLVGAWRYVEGRQDGVRNDARGPAPTGLMVYEPNGLMAVQIASSPAMRPKSDADEAGKLEAYGTYVAFWGRYYLHADHGHVLLHNDTALAPGMADQVGIRTPEFLPDGQMVMHFPVTAGRPAVTNLFERIP